MAAASPLNGWRRPNQVPRAGRCRVVMAILNAIFTMFYNGKDWACVPDRPGVGQAA